MKPILLYASDFWGCLELPQTNPIETLHMKFCKDLLGVQIRTANLGVLLELGRIPISIYRKKNAAKNWDRISLKHKANIILLTSYQKDNGWGSMMNLCFSNVNLQNVFLDQAPSNQASYNQLFYREKDIFEQLALISL